MDILDNAINKRLLAGNFPLEILHTIDEYATSACDVDTLAKEGIDALRKYPAITYGLFKTFANRVKEIELLNRTEVFEQEVNVLINTGYMVDSLNAVGNIYIEASKLCPAVTTVDKVLWYGVWTYYFSNDVMPDSLHFKQYRDMMFAWLYLLKTVKEKEIKYGLAINIKAITTKTNIIKLIEADWGKVDKKYFSKLTDYGIKKIEEVDRAAKSLIEKIEMDHASQKLVADRSAAQWSLFVDILNDLSQKEKSAICRINQSASSRDKLRIINQYNSLVDGISRTKYSVNGEEVNLSSLFECIKDRIQNASVYCVVKTDGGSTFRLHPAAFMLTKNPKTFNYLFLSFHQFRINPGKDTAKKFTTLALSALKRNLGEQESCHVSIDDIITDFYQTVTNFIQKNSEAIEGLSFESLRNDSAIVATEFASLNSDAQVKDLANRLTKIERSKEYDSEIERILTGVGMVLDANKVAELLQSEEERCNKTEQEDMASRIIVSLNIIYMFCEALRMILVSRHSIINIENRENFSIYRYDLLKIDEKLVYKVYAHLGEMEIGMLEYREKAGIITASLLEQEIEEENYRNSVVADSLKSSILSLLDDIETQDVEQILRTKAMIREEIFRFPDCDEKERYSEWLDNISQRLSDVLLANCQKEDDYQKIKDGLLISLGEKASILPESTVDSLTTAEMLYARYASEGFAKVGFDFSCISALYYQAFEEAYNKLIWKGYSDELNALEINGQKYTDILESCKRGRINIRDAQGYLDSDPKQRGYYIDYRNANRSETKVSPRCMYKSFAILLQNINPSTRLEKLCDYIAKIAGFSSRGDMFSNSDYMRNFRVFASAIDASADNRNNASHGGTFISVEQCKADKKIVLSELEAVRSDNLGLIQQLIFIVKN